MTFIGQDKIIKELNYIIPVARDTQEPFNILFSARTGYGKTHLGIMVIQRVGTYQIILKEDAREILDVIERGKTRVNFIDEVHVVKNIELLYPLMDSGKYFFVFATNQAFELKDAFKRRCIPLIFEKYGMTELITIARMYLQGFLVEDSTLVEIVKACVYSPGNIKVLCWRLRTIFKGQGIITLPELKHVLIEILNIQDGLDPRCREYLEILERLEVASLENIAHVMGISRDTVKGEIEPILLSKDLIKITSRGRSLH